MTLTVYVIDTSSLIGLNKHNPIDVYPGVWDRMDQLVRKERLFAPREVYDEISRGDDQLFEWSKGRTGMFVYPTEAQIRIVKEILAEYPSLIGMNKTYNADPWVIALALEMIRSPQRTLVDIRRIVVTEERIRGNRVKIPFICAKHSIESINILDLFRMEGWTF